MADKAPTGLTAATVPLAGTEVAHVVQGSNSRQTTAADIAKRFAAETANFSKGYTATAHDAGTISSGTHTPDPADGNIQQYTNGGAHTLAPPSVGDGDSTSMTVKITNNAQAGTITTSGFTVVGGDSLTTVDGDKFLAHMAVVDGDSQLEIIALQ